MTNLKLSTGRHCGCYKRVLRCAGTRSRLGRNRRLWEGNSGLPSHKVSAWEKNGRARSRLGRDGEKGSASTCENAGGRARANRRIPPKAGRCARMRAIRRSNSQISLKPGHCSIRLSQRPSSGEMYSRHKPRSRSWTAPRSRIGNLRRNDDEPRTPALPARVCPTTDCKA